ncbi:Ras-related and estrogen-regulated growth inhibitor-like protein [Halotydeus destructor]|nr:Ras-related and estrogen-regulated growth inhibitor-like protein [Halotydeus destructor]
MKTEMEIMDTSGLKTGQLLYDQISWADAFVIVYSVCETKSFEHARYLLETISVLKGPKRPPTILIGNKRDLEHCRQVAVDDGQATSLQWSCLFYEVSAAESFIGVSLAFQSLVRDAMSVLSLKSPQLRRKTSPAMAVSKMICLVFGKTAACKMQRKKRPSLSI